MDEALLHELSAKMGGRFKFTSLVQKRLVQLVNEHNELFTQNSGGRPVRLVVEEIAKGGFQLTTPNGKEIIAPREEDAEE